MPWADKKCEETPHFPEQLQQEKFPAWQLLLPSTLRRQRGESQPCHPVGTRKGQDGHSLAQSACPWGSEGSASTGGELETSCWRGIKYQAGISCPVAAKCLFKCVKVLNKEAGISFLFFCIFGKTDKMVMKGFSVFNLMLEKQPETPKFEGKLPNTSQSFPLTNKIKN